MTAVVHRALILLHLLLKLLLLHETNCSLSLLHSLGVSVSAATAAMTHVVGVIAAMAGVVGAAATSGVMGVMMIEIRISDWRIGDRMRISDRRWTRWSHRLRGHDVAIVGAVSPVTNVLSVIFVLVLVLFPSRFFLLDKAHHVIRQKEITVIVARVGTIFSIYKCIHKGVVPVGTACGISCHCLHLHHKLLWRHVHHAT